ncbi:hypothetical protein F4V91_30455 [Neorhizobium galegae]|uniref:Uncharacterized protein n=1 Tax=Neorhizobium galegae TaxID=399 RepID=A0A6A1TLA0_NEOGA|nr:hypothetical protein F4V91_30455 [Neorhizobium galegae]
MRQDHRLVARQARVWRSPLKGGQHHPQTYPAPPGNTLNLGRAADAHVLLPAPEGLSRTTTGTPGFAETSLIKDPIRHRIVSQDVV